MHEAHAAKKIALDTLEAMKINLTDEERKDLLTKISATSLNTKVHPSIAKNLTEICVESVLAIKPEDSEVNKEIDLHMVEIMEMQHRSETETNLVKGTLGPNYQKHSTIKNLF